MVHFLQEQLQRKAKVNFVKFDNEPVAWKEKLTEVNEDNLEDALHWVKGLKVNTGGGEMKKTLKWLLITVYIMYLSCNDVCVLWESLRFTLKVKLPACVDRS